MYIYVYVCMYVCVCYQEERQLTEVPLPDLQNPVLYVRECKREIDREEGNRRVTANKERERYVCVYVCA